MGVDVAKYNQLRDNIAQVEADLIRLRDPLRVNHPAAPFGTSERLDQTSSPIAASLWNRTQFRLQKMLGNAKTTKN